MSQPNFGATLQGLAILGGIPSALGAFSSHLTGPAIAITVGSIVAFFAGRHIEGIADFDKRTESISEDRRRREESRAREIAELTKLHNEGWLTDDEYDDRVEAMHRG